MFKLANDFIKRKELLKLNKVYSKLKHSDRDTNYSVDFRWE